MGEAMMPLWLELLVLVMLTYLAGFGLGWAIWNGRN
jgi:hypothetical protein